ncbi:cellulase family glycosylhydrolase [Fontisphaera persica]|uniref:cellulase family glycosylhydrolase n=1 Tax=Fontisphaera persica TaxID=2974023 RepID=UPI0024BF992E|nr:cellulase family glycosylhydrolase [Fontisphaera persica]WCJ60569.1 cellulase family glycosylhydrolase [Fontisphaera persica]
MVLLAPEFSRAAAPAAALVRVSPRDARYFELTDGTPYIPIGLNMIAPPGNRFEGMAEWMDELAKQGGNFIRVWLSNPYFDVEHVRSGEYDEEKARRIDELLAHAAARGIRVKMCMEHFRHLGEGTQRWAAKPLHLAQNGGPATNTAHFFDGEAGRRQFQEKIGWYGRRFGTHPYVFGWELWNEMNAIRAGDYMAWTEVMLPHLHRAFPSNLCMQSLGSFDTDGVRAHYRRLALMPGNDVAQVHRYLDLGARLTVCHGPVDVLAADAVRELLAVKPGKPVLLAESGAVEPNHSGPFKLYGADTNGVILHDVLFAPFFAGAAGPGHIWHWDSYVARNHLWFHFGRFAEAVKGVDPPAEGFEPQLVEVGPLRVYALVGRREVLLWCRDGRATWQTELQQGQAPPEVRDFRLSMQPFKISGVARASAYDPWKNQTQAVEVKTGGELVLPPFQRSLVVRILRK